MYDIEEKERLIKNEIKRLNKTFANIDEDKKSTVKSLIDNAAFLSVTLKELQTSINEVGTMTEYKNGENQYGTRQNPDVGTYNSFIQRYTTIIQTLINTLPKEVEKTVDIEGVLNDFKKPR